MRIISLQAENIKRLKAVEITPEGDIVVIAGRNGQGKTSVLDSIWYALGGGPAQKETARPIRDGEDRARVTLDLGKLVVTRTWKGETTSLNVMSKDGASYSSPQKMLDQLIGKLSFDPLAFTQQDQKTQLATLMDLVELPFDPDEVAGKRRALYDARTEIGREVKALEGQLAGIPEPAGDIPEEELSTAEIIGQQEAHAAAIVLKREAQQDEDDAERNIGVAEIILEQTKRELGVAKAAYEKAVKSLEGAKLDYESLASLNAETPEPERVDFRARLASVEEVNRQVRARREALRLTTAVTDARSKFDGLTGAISDLDASKAEALAAADMPLDDLAFDEGGVTYQGIPFAQCSSGEQLRVSMAMAMAANPEIRVIRITDGSLLDSENMALIAELAKDSDFQVWIERVDETGQVGVVIEDGAVAGVVTITTTPVCDVIAPAGQSYAEWQAFRTTVQGIGASEAAAALGLSPWKSPYSLYLEKVGEIDGPEENEHMAWGRKMEPLIAAEFFDRHPELEETPKAGETFRSIEHPHMIATPDRFATSKRTGKVGVVELKNVGLRLSGDWGDYPPDHVQCQVQHQLAVTGHSVGYVAALIGGNEMRDYALARDDALIANLIEAEAAFWQRVLDKTPPPVDGSDSTAEALREMWAASDPDSVIELSREWATNLLRAKELAQAARDEADDQLSLIKNEFMSAMGEYEIATVLGEKVCTWKKSERHSIDTKALRAVEPVIAEAFTKTTSVRTLRFIERKEET